MIQCTAVPAMTASLVVKVTGRTPVAPSALMATAATTSPPVASATAPSPDPSATARPDIR